MKAFSDFILDNDIIGFFDEPLTLKSGRRSHFYVNWRQATTDAWLLDQLTDFVAEGLGLLELEWDCLYGVPEGASKTAVLTALKIAKRSANFGRSSHTIAMGRGKAKDHGKPEDRYFIGKPTGKTLVLEDTTTTGQSLIAAIKQLQEAGVEVCAALGITDRCEKRDDGLGVADAIKAECGPIPYFALTKATDLLPRAAKKLRPSAKVLKALTEEFQRYGLQPLSWENL